jgi:hypothetical protein
MSGTGSGRTGRARRTPGAQSRAKSVALATFAFAVAAGIAPAAAQNADYVREARWAAEVVPQLVVGDAVRLQAAGREFLAIRTAGAGDSAAVAARPALVLVHGIGVHPDHGVIGELRTRLADAGFTTLSIQMPVLGADTRDGNDYVKTFDEAAARIASADAWLRGRGASRTVLVSHGMGAWMSNVYFERTPGAPYAAWVCLGITGRIGPMGGNTLPILDVRGENDLELSRRWVSVTARGWTLRSHPGSRQVEIAGADHHYAKREDALAREIVAFVQALAATR